MPCSGGSVYANVCARVMSSCTSDPKRAIFGAGVNKCFVYNEDFLSYETCRMSKDMTKEQGKLYFSGNGPFNEGEYILREFYIFR